MQIKSSKQYCFVAFHVLEKHIEDKSIDQQLVLQLPDIFIPLFVTYHIDGDRLRGCIGNLEGINFRKGLPQYSLIAAIKDPRFSPIIKKDLAKLSVSVSLLIDYEKCDPLDWEIGKHGLIMDYDGYSAVFLPEVSKEQGWDQQTTLSHLLQKSGCFEKLSDEIMKKMKCTRFQSSKECITWNEYCKMKVK